jgi:opacity protein-like surface antigen
MLRKLTLALVAAASLGAMALAPTAASAGGGGGWGGGYHHHHWGHGFGIGYYGGYGDDGCYVTRRVLTPFGFRFRTVNICEY